MGIEMCVSRASAVSWTTLAREIISDECQTSIDLPPERLAEIGTAMNETQDLYMAQSRWLLLDPHADTPLEGNLDSDGLQNVFWTSVLGWLLPQSIINRFWEPDCPNNGIEIYVDIEAVCAMSQSELEEVPAPADAGVPDAMPEEVEVAVDGDTDSTENIEGIREQLRTEIARSRAVAGQLSGIGEARRANQLSEARRRAEALVDGEDQSELEQALNDLLAQRRQAQAAYNRIISGIR